MGEGGRDLGGKGDERENMIWYWVGDRTEALRSSRKNVHRQPREEGGWEDFPDCTRDPGDERLSGLKVENPR